jgi:hypothetical protein
LTLLDQLIQIKADKESKGLFPTHIMITEIEMTEEVRAELNRLFKEGKIRKGETINSHFIEIL